MKKILLLSIFLFPFFISCASQPTDDLVIGEYGSLTGDTATFGQSVHKGVMLATEGANANGGLLGKKIRIVTEDDRSLAEEAATAVLKLIKQNKVVALIGEVASSRSLAAAPVAQKNKIPMISPASTNPQVTLVGDYIFRACFIDSFQGEAMAKFAFNTLHLKNVAILKDIKNDYSIGLADFFQKTFTALGGTITSVESYSAGDIDFRAQLTTVFAKNSQRPMPEGLFIPGYYTDVGLMARQVRELGFSGPLMGGDGWDSSKTLEIGGDAVENSYFSNHYSTDDPDPAVQNFINQFKEKYHEVPDAMAVLGYDATNMLFEAIRKSGSVEGDKIRSALAATQGFKGVSGLISMDADRNAHKKLVVLKIENHQFKFIQSVQP